MALTIKTGNNSWCHDGSGVYCFEYLSNNAPFYNYVEDHRGNKPSDGCLKYTDGEWRLETRGKFSFRMKTTCKFHHIWCSTVEPLLTVKYIQPLNI